MTLAQPNGPTQPELTDAAEKWTVSGCSVIPIRADGTKRPLFEWKRFQTEPATPAKLSFWIEHNYPNIGIGLVCGKISGALELFELESRAVDEVSMAKIADILVEGHPGYAMWDLLNGDDGFCETTPSGGLHYLYRISDHDVPGNTKIARRPATPSELELAPDDRVKVLAETRGEGGFVVVAPTGGRVHNRRVPWQVIGGEIGVIPTVTWAERCAFHDAIASALDQMPEPPAYEPRVQTQPTGGRPGDDYNARADWMRDILGPAGWTVSHQRGRELFLVRPGKDGRDGHSATIGYSTDGEDRLYVFSSSTEFQTEVPYSKFAAFALLNHGGNFAEATRALVALGFGDPRRPVTSTMDIPDFPVATGESSPRPSFLPKPRGIRDYTTSGACIRFVDEYGMYLRYVQESKSWRFWDGIRWAEDKGAARVLQAFEAMTETMYAEAHAMEDGDLAKSYKRHVSKLRDSGRTAILAILSSKLSSSVDDFDADIRYLNLGNGVWDTVDNKLLEHDPKYMLTKTMGVDFDPAASAPGTEKFLTDLIPDTQMLDYVMKALAYTMTGEADQRAFFLLQGLPGTGKTQFIEMMQQVFGDYGVTAMASTFHKRPANGGPTPDLHALRGARFITTSETSQDSQLDEELLKRFTGKDQMSTRTLWEAPQEWIPQGTIWFATNHLPKFSSDEDAIWRRVKTINFTTQFSDDGSIGRLSTPNVGRKLAASEASGIFNLMVAALALYRRDGRLSEPQQLKQNVVEHKKSVDPVDQFWDDMVSNETFTPVPGDCVDSQFVFIAYEKWCAENGIHYPMGRRRFLNSIRPIIGYEQMTKSNGKTFIPGWRKSGFIT